jgi:hypothetical protein
MDDESWHVRRLRELQAAAPVKRKKAEQFVKVPLRWIALASKSASSPATMVLIELLWVSWKKGSPTFPLPNARLKALGVNRELKRQVLERLERDGIILVERGPRKAPIITLLGL